jgi:hypothetical protein
MKSIISTYLFVVIIGVFCGCKKSYFEEKPSTNIVNPKTIADYNQLLDYITVSPKNAALATLSGDEYYYLSTSNWQAAASKTERNAYVWQPDIYDGELVRLDWNSSYQAIFYANSTLDGIPGIEVTSGNQNDLNFLKGRALFLRAYEYFDLVENFAPAYDSATAATDLGVPLKLKSEMAAPLQRSTIEQSYSQIIADLTEAGSLLTTALPSARNRPSKIAAMALFARIYLDMRKYSLAEAYADSCLKLYSNLINYNTVSTTSATPFSYTANDELILYSTMVSYPAAQYDNRKGTSIDSNLLKSYDANDLRGKVYFMNRAAQGIYMKRGYLGSSNTSPFSGLATDEVYLIKAECAARRNDLGVAMSYLNTLLGKRYVTGKYSNYVPVNAQDALNKILLERRKELVWRGRRWFDIKRLNKEGANITLTRSVNGNNYVLTPNSPLYTFPIPDDEISLSGIEQNQR